MGAVRGPILPTKTILGTKYYLKLRTLLLAIMTLFFLVTFSSIAQEENQPTAQDSITTFSCFGPHNTQYELECMQNKIN